MTPCRQSVCVVAECGYFLAMTDWYSLVSNLWTPYDPSISALLENAIQSGQSGIQIGRQKFDFRSMSETTSGLPVKRVNMSGDPEFLWECEIDGTWHEYDFFDCEHLSLAVSHPAIRTTVLYIGPQSSPYKIDTSRLRQTNLRTGYRRNIRKSPRKSSVVPSAPVSQSVAVAAPPLPPAPPPSASAAPSATPVMSTHSLSPKDRDILAVITSSTNLSSTEDCVICMEPLSDATSNGPAIQLPDCRNHGYHTACIEGYLRVQGKCPICQRFYVVLEGTQPPGSMSVTTLPPGRRPLDGYGRRVGTIEM